MLDQWHKPQQVQQLPAEREIGMRGLVADTPDQDVDPFVTGEVPAAVDVFIQVR